MTLDLLPSPPRISHSQARIDALDWFCGAGGTATGLLRDDRFRIISAANHDPKAVRTYGHNNPTIDVRQADLQEIDPRDFPPARILISTPECTNHSGAQAQRLYERGPAALDEDDPDFDFTEYLRQERSRATMACSLRYAERHRPEFVIHENVVEVAWWGVEIPGKKRGDGTTYQWWKREWDKQGYAVHELFMNASAFGAPQSRDRFIMLCRRKDVPVPNLEWNPSCYCASCDAIVNGVQTWKKRTKAWPLEEWGRLGKQYFYACPTCKQKVELITNGAHTITDWSNLGETIGSREDRGKPLAPSTVERVQHGLRRLGGIEGLVFLTRNKRYGTDGSVFDPMHTLTTRQDWALATPPAMVIEMHSGGSIKSGQRPVTNPLGVIASKGNHHYLATMPVAMWAKNNGGPTDTAYHPVTDPLGTVTRVDSCSLVTIPDAFIAPYYSHSTSRHVSEPMPTITTLDRMALVTRNGEFDVRNVHLRMYGPEELQLAQTFPADYEILGTKRERVKLIGDAVPPVLSYAVAERLGDALEGKQAIAA